LQADTKICYALVDKQIFVSKGESMFQHKQDASLMVMYDNEVYCAIVEILWQNVLYGQDADGNRGEWQKEIDDVIIYEVTNLDTLEALEVPLKDDKLENMIVDIAYETDLIDNGDFV
jgi:hypothetical protein